MFFFSQQKVWLYFYYFTYIMILSHRESSICSVDHVDVRNQIYITIPCQGKNLEQKIYYFIMEKTLFQYLSWEKVGEFSRKIMDFDGFWLNFVDFWWFSWFSLDSRWILLEITSGDSKRTAEPPESVLRTRYVLF